jgi:hypothetical protein
MRRLPIVPETGRGFAMTTGQSWRIVVLAAAASLLFGCAQPGPLSARRTKVGTLTTSLSHLEYQNEQLRRETAQLKAENRQIEDQLAQVEALNGDLTARLDDARNVISRGGGEPPGDPPQTLPAGRSSRTRRKPPFARIPGRIDTLPPADPADDLPVDPFDPPSSRQSDEFGPQGRLEDRDRWLPVVRDHRTESSRIR